MAGARNRVGLLNAAQSVQDAGRMGDTILAHISPEEARWLHQATDGASVNPHTGLLEFWDAGGASDADGGNGGTSGGTGSGAGGSGPDGGNGPGGGNGGGGNGGNGGGGSDPGASPGADPGGPSGPSGIGGLGSGNLGDLSAATSDPDADPERGSGLAGIDVTAAAPGVTGFGEGLASGMNPEMGGGLSRSIGHNTVSALGSTLSDVNAASAVAAGRAPSIGDDVSDFFGMGAPRGLLGSRAATAALGFAGSLVGGPGLGMLASLAHGTTLGNQPPGEAFGSAVGGMVGGPLGGWAGGRVGAGLDAMGSAPAGAITGAQAPDMSATSLSQSSSGPNPYAEALGVDSADIQRRGLLNQRRTFTPIRM